MPPRLVSWTHWMERLRLPSLPLFLRMRRLGSAIAVIRYSYSETALIEIGITFAVAMGYIYGRTVLDKT